MQSSYLCTWFKLGLRLPILALSIVWTVWTKYSDKQLSRSRDLQPGQSRWTPFGNWFSFPAALVRWQQVNCFFFCERNSGLDLSKGGIRSPKSISERRKDSATLPPCPLDPIHRFLLRGVSWQFNITLYFEFHYVFPLTKNILFEAARQWHILVIFGGTFLFNPVLIRTKLLQCISSAGL